MDTGNGAALVYRKGKQDIVIPMPIIGHWLKKAWGSYFKLSKYIINIMTKTLVDRSEEFIETLDNKFRMINRDELLQKYTEGKPPLIIDFRGSAAFEKSHIKNSINIDIKNLSESIHLFDKNKEIVAVCNGSIQSGYAIYYLYLNGFSRVYNLSGGFSGCEKNNFSLLTNTKQ